MEMTSRPTAEGAATRSANRPTSPRDAMLATALSHHAFVLPHAQPQLRCGAFMCDVPPPASSMRVKDLKAELDALGVTWRGICFEKEDLVDALEKARVSPPPAPPPPSTPSPPPPPAATQDPQSRFGGFGDAVAQAEAEAAEVNAMSVEEIKAELSALDVDYSTAGDDKAKLVSELLNARAFARPMFDTEAFQAEFGNKNTQW